LAAKIYEKITLVEKELMEVRQFIENAYANYQKRNVLLSKEDLSYLAPYEDKLYLPNKEKAFVKLCKDHYEKIKRRRKLVIISSIIAIALLAITFGIRASRAQKEAELQAKIQKSKSLGNKACEFVESDPTLAYLLAEEAYDIYPTSEAERGIINSYLKGPFYTILIASNIKVSNSKKYILARNTEDNILRLYDNEGKLLTKFLGHTGTIMYNGFKFSLDERHIITESIEDSSIRVWDLNGIERMKLDNASTSIHNIIANLFLYTIESDGYNKFDFTGEFIKKYYFKDSIYDFVSSDNLILTKSYIESLK
jgi:hypothetical protein